jgi:hypothetical protein
MLLDARLQALRPGWEMVVHAVDHRRVAGYAAYYNSQMAYARLLLPELVPLRRILYLDADVLVLRNLEEIHEMALDGCLAAAARDLVPTFGERFGERCAAFGLEPGGAYFNSGVMLIDLEGWRRERVHMRAFEELGSGKRFDCADQCALNLVMHGRIKRLPALWNSFYQLCSSDDHDWDESRVIHYASPWKPWLYYDPRPPGQLFYLFAKWAGVPLPRTLAFRREQAAHLAKHLVRPLMPPAYRTRALLKRLRGRAPEAEQDRAIARLWTRKGYFASGRSRHRLAGRLGQ